ncbi:MAG: YjbH domain-containing protein [Nitrospirae bacterium]|nr:YjbH domain-containing protein [Nitrospirota bacterium]
MSGSYSKKGGKSLTSFLALLLFSLFPSFSPSFASDEPFVNPANWGGTGLLEIPNARVLPEGRYRMGISQIKPYRYYYLTLSPLKRLEITGRITEVIGVPALLPGYGNAKDKAIDLKFQILQEDKYLPAVAIGIMDPQGTRHHASQYIVASKQIYPFDFTIGMGNGRFGKEPLPSSGDRFIVEMFQKPREWWRTKNFFWGVEFALSKRFALVAEHSPIKYHLQTQDPAQAKYFSRPVPSPYNFGIRIRPSSFSEIDLSYQRGDKIGLNFSMSFDIGRPMIPIYDHPYKEHPTFKDYPIETRLSFALLLSGFSNIGISLENKTLIIHLENHKYLSNMKALVIALKAIGPIIPEEVNSITLIFKERGIPIFSFHTTRMDLADLLADKLNVNEFFVISDFQTKNLHVPKTEKGAKLADAFMYGYKPHFQLFLNDPSGFLKGKLGILGWVGYIPWESAAVVAGVGLFPFANISTVNEPLSIPVRTDIVDYIKKKVVFDKLLFEQIYRFSPDIFTRFAVGFLEMQYAGLDFEIAKPFFNGRLLLGLSGSSVKKRDPDNPFLLKKDNVKNIYNTAFFNTRINFPKSEVLIDIKYGRFLAGDIGTKVTVSKNIKGVVLSAWYSITDTTIFNDNANRGYHDKGIGVLIPIRLFKGTDTRMVYEHKISPWTRDVAQDIEHFTPLFDFIGRNTKIFLDKDKKEVYK